VPDGVHLLAATPEPCVDFGFGADVVFLQLMHCVLQVTLGLVALVIQLLEFARRPVNDVTCEYRESKSAIDCPVKM
jgi:hypothetical protein